MKNSTAVILILIAAGLTYTFTMSEWGQIGGLQAQEASYNQVLDDIDSLTAKRDELFARYKNISPAQLDQLQKILPNNVDTVTLALNLDSMASKYGISVKSVSTSTNDPNPVFNTGAIITSDTTANAPYQTVYVNFEFTSTYDNFRKLMADIERSLRVIDARSVAFKVGQNNLYDYKVSIQTYWTK